MAKSPIKRMQEAELKSHTTRGYTSFPQLDEWKVGNHSRWSQRCTVTLAGGLVVNVWCRGGSDGDYTTEAYTTFLGRRYWVSFPYANPTKESTRRLAVAFAKRVQEEAKG